MHNQRASATNHLPGLPPRRTRHVLTSAAPREADRRDLPIALTRAANSVRRGHVNPRG
jgi:hypothetical protein